MPFRPGLLSVAAAILAGSAVLAQDQVLRDNRLYRSGIELTSITATVRDAEGRLVTGLERDAFEVYEDGALQEITQFTNERVPVSLGVLFDASDSMFGQRVIDARAAVEYFLFNLLDDMDEYFVLSFNHQPRVLTGWTATPDIVRRALGSLKPWGGRPLTTPSSRHCRCSRTARASVPPS